MEGIEFKSHEPSQPMNIAYPLLAASIILYVLHYIQNATRIRQLGSLLPGPPSLPFLGHSYCGLISPDRKFKNFFEKLRVLT